MDHLNIAVSGGNVVNPAGLPVYYDLYTPIGGGGKELPVVLFLHGFKGFKDWGPFPDACEVVAASGFAVLAFNFSHNGIGAGRTEYQRLDLFENNTLSADLEDVLFVIDALQTGKIQTRQAVLNTDKIGIIGHSRGGFTAIAAAAESESVQCLVTWAAVADYSERISQQNIDDWEKKGYTEYLNGRTGQKMKVNRLFYDDLLQNKDKLTAINRVKVLDIPVLFIHGRDDETVPQSNAEQLYISCASKEKELRYIGKAGHTFGGAHPFTEDDFPAGFKDLLENTTNWFEQYLR